MGDTTMPVLVILIISSLSFYVYYKARYFRSKNDLEKKWISSKSSIALGLFVALFGLNQFFLYHTTVTYIVGGLFILIGSLSAWSGYRAYRHYLPYILKQINE
jgi:hypothetical protein